MLFAPLYFVFTNTQPVLYPLVKLKRKKAAILARRHPWIFSGAVFEPRDIEDGQLVHVIDEQENIKATGHFHHGSIMVRVLAFEECQIDAAFFQSAFENARAARQLVKIPSIETNSFRLIHGEGDSLPGLVIDIYDQVAVVQCHSIGMHKQLHDIATALQAALGDMITAIYSKSCGSLPKQYVADKEDGFIWNSAEQPQSKEFNISYSIDFINGQKTGFFLDQRDNRALLRSLADKKTVLNLFSYSGGFSIAALFGGATKAISIDSSKGAIELANANAAYNGVADRHLGIASDVNAYLNELEEQFDIVVCDPPAYAKNLKARHRAVQGYKRLNIKAIKAVKPGGMLMTFSCSQVVGRQLFEDTIVAAVLESGRTARITHRLNQPADHPTSATHPEGSYLKGLALIIN